MLKLNLVYQDKSDITFKRINFPDGQNQINIINNFNLQKPITIYSRLNNFLNLEEITCAVASLRELGVKEIHLYTPFFLGSRSDRQFEDGSNNYLKDVICPIINSLNFESVTVLDPHSFVLEGCLNNFKPQSNLDLVKFALNSIYNENKF